MKNTTLFSGSLLAVGLAFAVMNGGCYTQIATIDKSGIEGQRPDTCTTCDSAKTGGRDTVVIRNNDRETCFWTRDWLGNPEYRCVNSYYSRDWYSYQDYPWWYGEWPYYYDYSGRCPRYSYYDRGCGCCRYYDQVAPWFDHHGGGSSTGGGTSLQSDNQHRSRSYGVPGGGTPVPPASGHAPKQLEGSGSQERSVQPPPPSNEHRRSRDYGVPGSGDATAPPPPPKVLPKENQQPDPPPRESPAIHDSPAPASDSSGARRPHREPRSW